MQSPADRWPRIARSAVFALAAVTLAALAHTLGHGVPPRLPVLVGAALVVFAGARLAAGKERSLAGIAGAMGAVQMGLHIALTLTSAPMSSSGAAIGVVRSSSAVLLPAALCRPAGMARWAMGQSGGAFWTMIAAHALAALLLAWALRRGEASVWALARIAHRTMRSAVRRRLTPGVGGAELPGGAPQPVWGTRPVHRLRDRLLRHCLVLRGPPALAA